MRQGKVSALYQILVNGCPMAHGPYRDQYGEPWPGNTDRDVERMRQSYQDINPTATVEVAILVMFKPRQRPVR